MEETPQPCGGDRDGGGCSNATASRESSFHSAARTLSQDTDEGSWPKQRSLSRGSQVSVRSSPSQERSGNAGDITQFPALRQRSFLMLAKKPKKGESQAGSDSELCDDCESRSSFFNTHFGLGWKARIEDSKRSRLFKQQKKGKARFEVINWSNSQSIDFHFWLLDTSILVLLAFVALTYGLISIIFAAFFQLLHEDLMDPDQARPDGFSDFGLEVYFSLENVLAVGFGSFFPEETDGYVLSVVEHYLGTIVSAILLGILATKVTRPRSNIMFSKVTLITYRNDTPYLIVRFGNIRGNNLYFPHLRLVFAKPAVTSEGETYFKFVPLKIEDVPPYIGACFHISHKIDESSPLFGIASVEDLPAGMRIYTSVAGVDDVHYTTVNSVRIYFENEFVFGSAFEDMVSYDPSEGAITADMSKLSQHKKQTRVTVMRTARAWLAKMHYRKENRHNEKLRQMEDHIKDRSWSQLEEDFAKHCVNCTSG